MAWSWIGWGQQGHRRTDQMVIQAVPGRCHHWPATACTQGVRCEDVEVLQLGWMQQHTTTPAHLPHMPCPELGPQRQAHSLPCGAACTGDRTACDGGSRAGSCEQQVGGCNPQCLCTPWSGCVPSSEAIVCARARALTPSMLRDATCARWRGAWRSGLGSCASGHQGCRPPLAAGLHIVHLLTVWCMCRCCG